jgi:hypothetical protein
MFQRVSDGLEEIIGYGAGGKSGLAASSNVPQAQPTIEQPWHHFEPAIDSFEEHHNILGAQQSGKQILLQQPDAGIAGKGKAIEMEEQKQPEIQGEKNNGEKRKKSINIFTIPICR